MEESLYMNDLLIKSVLLKGIPKDYPKYKKYEYLDKLQDLDQYMIYDNNQLDTLWINMKLNRDLRELNAFVNKNIVLKFGRISDMTFGVLLRIATGMLNKCNSITEEDKLRIHRNLCLRLHLEFNSVINEMLPF